MKVLVTGYNGQLGYDVVKELRSRDIDCVGTSRAEMDITDLTNVEEFVGTYLPDVIVHCAAFTAVDKAEDEKEDCTRVNVIGTRNIAQVCKKIGAKMVYISTDYVFSGDGDLPYEVGDKTNPLGIYGKTKLEGEKAVKEVLEKYFIIRVSWVFGKNGNNFIKTMLRVGKERDTVNVVCDQIGSPTYTVDLSKLICDMINSEIYGVYHATNEGYCSWAELATEAFRLAGYHTEVNFIHTSEYPTKAQRPLNSRMSKTGLDKAGFSRLPDWKDAVRRYLIELGE